MPLLSTPKRRNGRGICQSPILLTGICIILLAVVLLVLSQSYLSPSRLSRLKAKLHITGFNGIRRFGPHKQHVSNERFATLFHLELAERFNMAQGRDNAHFDELIATLRSMESVGITTVVFSSPWGFLQPTVGPINFDYLDLLVSSACQNTRLKVAFIFDLVRAPQWVFEKWPNAKAADSHNRQYNLLSWFHPEANQLALEVLKEVVTHLATSHAGCVTSVQPAFNNEYEAKYTQEHDCFQDYSTSALTAYRQWLQARRPQLADLNKRWGTNVQYWEDVAPPMLEAGSVMGPDLKLRYWDFLKFRELSGAEVLNRACSVVHSGGIQCFHHVPELFTVLVAVYGTTIFKHIAAHAHTDYLVVDASFSTSYGSPVHPTKLRLSVAAAIGYGKPVHLGAAVQQSTGYGLLSSAFRTALLADAAGVGITNWLPYTSLNNTLKETLHPSLAPGHPEGGGNSTATCAKGVVSVRVGLFIHFDSCAAWHGLQWSSDSKDPVHDFIEAAAQELTFECAPHLSVYLEFDRLMAALPSLDRVLFVEPLVVWAGQEFKLYTAVKAAITKMPHEILQFPGIQETEAADLTVLAEL
ncbi:hypothetical protein Vretimale_7259 [Volvox reticuliferus]|uniref:Glycoside hydrolase family 42 N-terminal domain-containing protein n=1 Tax=Volvox reticuliferus TaxID=1737510 RepID=A0A8J4G968_9CHLO|nr:hypothetical protein Vretifemale_11222 [Volvox reticuliferus]GIM02384.1 hypothetical protein Vretimale_7259 [Volvox reticuliferus]